MRKKIQELIEKTVGDMNTLIDLRSTIDSQDKKELEKLDCVLRFMRGFKTDLQDLLKTKKR